MATFTWRERLKVWVGEMNRAAAVHVAREINTLLKSGTVDEITLGEILGELLILNSPYKLSLDDQPLHPEGVHPIAIDGYDGSLILTLPLKIGRAHV